MALALATLVFLSLVTLTVGVWWAYATRRRVRERLQDAAEASRQRDAQAFRADPWRTTRWATPMTRTRLYAGLTGLLEAADVGLAPINFLLLTAAAALAGGAAGWLRTWQPLLGVATAACAGAAPVLYLLYRRHRRIAQCEQQLPDALDMITRSIRAGYALTGAIQLAAEESPDPIGGEFRRISEEIRLGMDPGEALLGLQRRIPTSDIEFFCTAIRIQRSAGGNLAEILDRLSEVIRERFKLLSHARALSAQHRWSAVCIGLSPVAFAMLFALQSPGYFDPLLASPLAPYLIAAGVFLEAIGFFVIWRIAQIQV